MRDDGRLRGTKHISDQQARLQDIHGKGFEAAYALWLWQPDKLRGAALAYLETMALTHDLTGARDLGFALRIIQRIMEGL